MEYRSVNPTDGQLVGSYPTADEGAVEIALDRAARAAGRWGAQPLAERAALLRRAADTLESRASELGALMAVEMGKPLGEAEAEVKKCAWACRYYADNAAGFLAARARESDGTEAYVRYDPLGPLFAIMPWNFPFWQFFRFAAPALAAGNVVLLKHAPNTPGCARRIESLLHESGAPEGVVQNLFLSHDQAARVIADPRVRGVTLTGSTRAGREVASTAGRHLKTMVLELGGSDAFIVLDDADIERSVEAGVTSRCLNNGQSCVAAKRFLVQRAVFDRFRDAFVERMSARVMGDPTDRDVQLGPLARADLRERLADQVGRARSAGAVTLTGGEPPDRPGFFYPATVLDRVEPGSPAAVEELFGPVAALIPVADDDEAVAVANRSTYGLGSSLWTRDRERAARIVPRIEAGSVFVNGMVKSDPRLPFGGIKDSGFGRELGREGMLEFVNRKTVWAAWP